MTVDPLALFPEFYANPTIQTLAPVRRWTVSGRLSDAPASGHKAPIDVRHLIEGCRPECRHEGPVRGAFTLDSTCLMSLGELVAALPKAANHAYYLQSHSDGVVVVDVEPDCPPDLAANLLRLPGVLWAETSMSGRGYHLVMPRPKNLHDFPHAAHKRVLRERNGWFEILLDHWITFTRRPVDAELAGDGPPARFASLEDLYAALAENARASAAGSAGEIVTDEDMPDIPGAHDIVAAAIAGSEDRRKDLSDFDHDRSRWEFSVLGTLYAEQVQAMNLHAGMRQRSYSARDQAWLLYTAAVEVLPKRAKHTETRNGRPYLLDRAASLVADRQTRAQERSGGDV